MSGDSAKLDNANPVELTPSDADAQVQALLNESGEPIRIRILAQLYDRTDRNYDLWRGVNWRLKVEPSFDNIRRVRRALQACMEALAVLGPEQLCHVLAAAMPKALPMSPVTSDEEEAGG
jgi:hypothetical protein